MYISPGKPLLHTSQSIRVSRMIYKEIAQKAPNQEGSRLLYGYLKTIAYFALRTTF